MIVAILFPLLHVLLLSVPPALAASGDPSAFTPEAPPEACRDCGGVQYFRPVKKSEKAKTLDSRLPISGMTEKSKNEKQNGVPLSHLSSDPRVRTARILISRNRFPEALEILRPLAPDHPDQTDVQFLLGLGASRWSQEDGLEDEQRLALLDEAIAAFRSILIRRPELVRVRLELALAFYLKQDDSLAREHFERAPGGPPARGVGRQRQTVL